jgi:hypothetical protein
MVTPQFKGAFAGCSWCGGRGCNQCSYERQKWFEAHYEPDGTPQPIFTANPNDPEEMELLNMVVGRKALERAFGPGGGGIVDIHKNAALATMLKALRGKRQAPPEGVEERETGA